MKKCPHCCAEIMLKELPHQGFFVSYRICPKCDGFFTADTDTKYRQALLIVIMLISLVFTIFLYFGENEWLTPAIVSYVAFVLILYWGNKKIYFVPYKKPENK